MSEDEQNVELQSLNEDKSEEGNLRILRALLN